VLLVGGALTAEAAPKKKAKTVPPVCNLVQDAKGDATQLYILGEGSVPNEPALDIVSADVASNGKQMTTAIRVDKLARNSNGSPYGNIWYVYFNVGGIDFFTQAQSPRIGDVFSVGYVSPDTGIRTALPDNTATGMVDLDKNEVRVTFNLAQLTPQATAKPGSKITGLRGLTNRSAVRIVLQSDEAIGSKSYVEGSPSCVAVGK
jgi:hypothetical protein